MHPSTQDLLKLRDGEPIDAQLQARLMADPRATAELERLERVKTALCELPELAPPADAWSRIRSELEWKSRGRSRLLTRCAAGLAVAAGVAAVAILVTRTPDVTETQGIVPHIAANDDSRETRLAAPVTAASYAGLLEESARLERVLTRLPAQRHLMRVGTASTITGLEDQILLIDAHMTTGAARGFEPEYRDALLRTRVDVMNALIHVRYAQSEQIGY